MAGMDANGAGGQRRASVPLLLAGVYNNDADGQRQQQTRNQEEMEDEKPATTATDLFGLLGNSGDDDTETRTAKQLKQLVDPAPALAPHVSDEYAVAALGTPPASVNHNKRRRLDAAAPSIPGGLSAGELRSRGIAVVEIDAGHLLRSTSAASGPASNPILQHLSASTRLSLSSLAKKATTDAEALDAVFAANRAKKRSAAARYGF